VNETATARRRRPWGKYLARTAAAGLAAGLLFFWYIQTDSFQAMVRRRFVAEVERVTGGRAEIESFHTVPLRMRVEVRGLTVHGLEPAGEAPLLHVDQISARIKVISLLRSDFGFHYIVVEHPVVHLKNSADGATNLPAPRVANASERTPPEQLFALSVNKIEIHRGELLLEDQKLPLELAAEDLTLAMNYSFLRNRYDGNIAAGKVDAAPMNWRAFAWSGNMSFSLGTNFLEVKSLTLTSGKSRLSATGRINDFRKLVFAGKYDARIDLEQLGDITRQYGMSGGSAELRGQGSWAPTRQEATGQVVVRDFAWHDESLNLQRAGLSADFTIDPEVLKFSKIDGSLWGGKFSGLATVRDWTSAEMFALSVPPDQARRGEAPEQSANEAAIYATGKLAKRRAQENASGTVELKLQDLSHEQIAQSLNTAKHPLGRFHPVGTISGTVNARWQRAVRNVDVEFALNAAPPAKIASGETAVTAKAAGTYHNATGGLELSQFSVNTPSTVLTAAGALNPTSGLRVNATTSNLEEWGPVIAVLGGPSKLPVSLSGEAAFRGTMTGSLSSPILNGTVTAQDFDVTLPPIGKMGEHDAHVDSFSAGVTVSAHELTLRHATAESGQLTANFEGEAALQNFGMTPSSTFRAHADVQGASLEQGRGYVGENVAIAGSVNFTVDASGTQAAPHANGSIHVLNADIYGEKIRKLDSQFTYADDWITLTGLDLFRDGGELKGDAAYNPKTRAIRADLSGSNVDLAGIRQIQTKELHVDGLASFTLKAGGTIEAPSGTGHLQAKGLTFDGERSGDFDADVSSDGHEVRVTGQSQFVHGTLNVKGTIGLAGGYPMDANFAMDHLDLDPLWVSYLKGNLTGHSAVGGTLRITGPMIKPDQWVMEGKLNDVYLDVEYAKLHNEGPVTFRSERQLVKIDPLRMVGEGTDVTGHGMMDFAGAGRLDLFAVGKLDLKLADSFVPDLTSSGTMIVDMHVTGTMEEPYPQGKVQISNGAAAYAGLPTGLSEMNGQLTFSQGHFFVDSLTGKTGGGTLEFKGDATYFHHNLNFNLTAVGKDVRLRYPPGVSSTADATIHWVGTPSASTLSGDVLVNKLAVTPGFDFSAYLGRGGSLMSLVPADSPLYRVKLDVHVATAPELQMKTAIARLSGDADLRLRGSLANPAVLGRAEILEGDVMFNGTRFHLERGDITFANPVSIDPQVNLQASTRVRNYDINLIVTGRPTQTGGLTVNYRADPPLPQSDIISLLALGRTNQESEQLGQQSVGSQLGGDASALLLTQALNSAVTSRLQRLFGVSRIKVDPQGAITDTNALARGPQVTIEQQFANNLTLSYSTNLSQQSNQQIIRGEYYLRRDVSVVGLRDRNGVVSFDVRVRRRKK